MTSSYSKASAFVHPHVNEKPAFSKIFSLESVFEKITFSVTKKISIFKQNRTRVYGANNVVFSRNVQSSCFDN